ncbi:MAG: type II toxin-antitoxin system VapC family toxin [Planctomycetaceae bacterium]|jgi:predicted nucleic acid-binding protein|nr:type II toxin-antitoxin system VapC family toxin [Planctomycetaceae bacterium]
MIYPLDLRILLDTCILVFLVRGNADGEIVEQRYSLSQRKGKLYISSISLGEILAFAKRNHWQGEKCRRLYQLLEQVQILSAGDEDVVGLYANLKVESDYRGYNTGQNDLWIAATAQAAGAILLTADNDFHWMQEEFLDIIHYVR